MFDQTQPPETPEPARAAAGAKAILLYDERCGVCRAAVRAATRWSGAGVFEPVGIRTPVAASLVPNEDEATRLEAFHLIVDGQHRKGADALPALFDRLPGLGFLAWVLRRWPPAAAIAASAYRWVCAHRPAISRVLPRSWQRPLAPSGGGYHGRPRGDDDEAAA
ncbi:MAG TPA: DCC1-like thiol-disulfide oxidoreductase family protein [Actinomycetota bacterium]|jgi:predicted DCC family thiol-disulfide oxidoreductase YuxK